MRPIYLEDTGKQFLKYFTIHVHLMICRLALTPERKRQLELKVLAEKLFKGVLNYLVHIQTLT